MQLTSGTKIALGLGLVCGSLYLIALIFRATIYHDLYISPNDPYGVADIMELFLVLIGGLFILVSVFVSLVLLVRGEKQSKKSAIFLILWCILICVSYFPLHEIATRWN